jgi:hypothetical protein
MTVPPSNATPQPGWYPAPNGSGRLQWWDGQSWTGHFNNPYPPRALSPRPKLSEDTEVYNPFIWLVAVLPLVPILFLLGWNPVLHFRRLGPNQLQAVDPSSIFSVAYFLAIGSVWLVFAVCALLAFLDWQRLRRDGVVRPFHWAWVFLNPAVYVVGRSIIVHQVAPRRGLTPIWVLIGVYVLTFLITAVKVATLFSSLSSVIPT